MQKLLQHESWMVPTAADAPGVSQVLRVLQVEDEAVEALLVQDMLEQTANPRFVIKHVTRVRDGLEALREGRFDVILLDLSLPDATDLCGVQQMALAAVGIPIVVFTGLDNDSAAIRAMQCGAQDYLIKGRTDASLLVRAIRYSIQRKRADEQTAWLARFDPLTGLANRATFRDSLTHAIARACRDGSRVALLFIDLDRFKSINDTLGHEMGDLLLKEIARRLKATVRESDIVARIGGDEFTVILEGLEEASSAGGVAAKILESLSQPIELGSADAYVTPSIGIAVYPDCGTDADSLLRNADWAMYHVKSGGRNNFHFSGARLGEAVGRRRSMGEQLSRALDRDELKVHYQPKVELRTGRIIGAEALLRWQSANFGAVGPGDFIPLAEECGQIHRIGEFALRQACLQSAQWRRTGLLPVPVAVNVSAKQLRDCDFVNLVARILGDCALGPDDLEIELTESVLVSDVKACREILARLKSMGVRIGVDDFGTGYSSLAYLKRLPLDVLKIDCSFVRELGNSADDAAIVQAIIALGRSLHLSVVAEGVETIDQRDFLDSCGCTCAQGFLYYHPVDAEAFAALLRTDRALPPTSGHRSEQLPLA